MNVHFTAFRKKLVFAGGAVALCAITAVVAFQLTRDRGIRKKVEQTERDLLTLQIAIELNANWWGGMVPIPDALFLSESARERYDVQFLSTQPQIDELLDWPVNSDLMEHLTRESRLGDWDLFYMRHREWRCLTEPTDVFTPATLVAEGKLEYKEAFTFDAKDVPARGVPSDPFSSAPYRYLLMPDFTFPYTYLIAGNGPDRDADLTPSLLLSSQDNPSFELDYFDAIYDPTNGAASGGDIVLCHDLYNDSRPGSRRRLPYAPACDYLRYMKKHGIAE